MLHGNYVEVQFSRRSILDLVRTALVLNYPPGNPLLPPTGREFPVADDGQVYRVTQTSFLTGPGAMSLRRGQQIAATYEWSDYDDHTEAITAQRCEVTQRLRLDVARKVQLPGGARQDVDLGTVEGTLLVTLSAWASDNVPYFTVEPRSFTVETPGLPQAVVASLQRHLTGSFGQSMTRLPIAGMLRISNPVITNCGLALSQDGSVVSLRTQVGPSSSRYQLGDWTDFHAGAFPNRLVRPDGSTAQWGMLLSPSVVESLVAGSVADQLAEHTGEFRLVSGIGCDWVPGNGEARVSGGFTGDLLIPCRPRYQVSFNSRLSVSGPNTLASHGYVDWDGDDWDLIACETLVALSVGLVGGSVGLASGGPLGMAVGAGLGFFVGFFSAVLFATFYTPDLSSPNCTADGNSFNCTINLNLSLQFGGATLPVELLNAVGTDDGLLLAGSYTIPPIPALRHSLLTVETEPFHFTPLPVSCGNLLLSLVLSTDDERAREFTAAQAVITLRLVDDDGTVRPVPQTTVQRLSLDPAGVFPAEGFRVASYADRTVITITARVSAATSAAYFAKPYGLTVEVRALGTSRIVELGTVPELTPQVMQRLRGEAQAALNKCLAKRHDLGGGVFDLDWLVDPPPDGRPHDRLWQIGAMRLDPGDVIVATTPGGEVLGSAAADAAGIARLRLLTPGGAEYDRLELIRRGERDLGHEADLRIKQITMVLQSSLALDGRLAAVETAQMNGRRLVAVRTEAGVTVYDLTFPESPRAYVRGEPAGDGEGALGRVLAAGAAGPGLRALREPGVLRADTEAHARAVHVIPGTAACRDAPAAGVSVGYVAAGSAFLVPAASGERLDCYVAGASVSDGLVGRATAPDTDTVTR